MVSAGFVQTGGLRVCVLSSDVGRMVSWRSVRDLKTPRRMAFWGESGEEVLDGVEP